MTQTIQIQDQNFVLHPSGTLFWKEQATLLISDVHLGKISHFRKFGAAVPQSAIYKNFELMDSTIAFFAPRAVCFLGDLFHSSLNKEWDLFEKWINKSELKFILVRGNHDIISPLRYQRIGIEVVSELASENFLLTHHPEHREGYFNFSGHIHPAIKLNGKGKQSLRLPCFFKSQNQLILPAFGKFTGSHTLKKKENDEVYAIADDDVIKI
ncbi:ligase-associated DNA damage response endonuclease PdeM [uncultured Eudoraea sp.]|uniref:ligase-associated DNA damage response endonuclease PdeM n=1 Tax=uncultured Eudoraea sp. TaxID=1035614 RepID=UPI00262D720F|nr:ligase-associated DNA damage response endonuclease PdeM [uncultured Eudoraea sp.]